jgi:multidrug resistance protein, MATE family
MERAIDRNLQWRRRPFLELTRLAWPIAISTLSYSTMTLVSTLFVGRVLGESALAGVGLGGVAAFGVMCFGFGTLRGSKVLVSQAIGAGDHDTVGKWLWTGVWTALALGIAMAFAGLLIAGYLPYFAASEAAGVDAQVYLTVRMTAAPISLLYCALREHRWGLSDTRSPMIASVVGNIANVALDCLFILVLDWGVAGAAWATVLGQAVETGMLVVVEGRASGFRPRKVTLKDVRTLLDIGLPTGAQFLLEVGAFTLLTAIVSSLGERQMAAHQIALQVVHFSFLPTMALAEAASVLAGQAVGAGAMRLVRRVARLAAYGAVGYTAMCTLVLVFFGRHIAAAFTADPGLQATTVGLLFIAAFFQMSDGAAMVGRAVLRGTGDVRFPAVAGIVCSWLCTPPFAWFFGRVLGLGALGGWIGISVEITLMAILFWLRLERGGWLGSARRSRARLRAERAELALQAI